MIPSPPRPRPAALLRRLGTALLVLAAACGGSARLAHAQDTGEGQRVTLVAVGVPLQTALEALIDQTRIALVYDNTLVAGRTAFCRAEREPLGEALRCVLRGTGLDFARLSSGTYTLFPSREDAPRYGGVTGEVVDADTGAPLAGAHVVLATADGSEPHGAASNGSGRFALPRLLPGTRRLVVSHVGYRDAEVLVRVEPDEPRQVVVALRPEVVLAAPVVVSGLERRVLSERLGKGRLEGRALTGLSDLASGESDPAAATPAATPDVVRTLGGVVGVRAGEALADVHVQGGAVSEHAFTLDGAPVFVPVSLGGLVGPFSPFALERVTVRKAGFGSAYGSYLAGVVEATSVTAPPAGAALVTQVDPLSFNARWTGRAGRPEAVEGTWALTLRQGLWATLRPPTLADRLRSWSAPDAFLIEQLDQEPVPDAPEGFPVELGFTDAHAAGRLRLGGLRSLHGSLYLARHAFGVEDVGPDDSPADDLYEDAYRWANATGQLRYEWVPSARVFAHVGGWASGYGLRRPDALGSSGTAQAPDEGGDDFGEIAAGGVRAGLDIAATPRQWVTAGLEITRVESGGDGGLPDSGLPDLAAEARAPLRWTVAGNAEDRITMGRAVLTLGTRLTWLPERQTLHAEPRASIRYDGEAGPLGPWALRLAAGRYLQFLTAVDVADGGPAPLLPDVRLWLPLPADARPPEAYHLAAEALVQPRAGWELGVEAYVKHQPHLLVANYGGVPGVGPLVSADGYAGGVALRAERRTERLHLAAAYEFAVARRRTPGRFGGAWVPAPWDAPHHLRASVDAVPLAGLTLTARGEAVFGRAWGFRQAYYDLLASDPATRFFAPFDLGEPGAHRLPAFLQLDLSVAYTTIVRGVGLQARMGLVNALGRDNVRDWLLAPGENDGYVRRPRYATPWLPVFSLRLSR